MKYTNMKTLKNISEIVDEFSDHELEVPNERIRELLANISVLSEELKTIEAAGKAVLIKRGIEKLMYPEVDRKVVLGDEKKSTEYYAKDIYGALQNRKLEDYFFDIVNIVMSKIDEIAAISSYDRETIQKICVANSKVKPGKKNSVISVRKLSQEGEKELLMKKVQ